MRGCFDLACSSYVTSEYVNVNTYCTGSNYLPMQIISFPRNDLGIAYAQFMDKNILTACNI